MKKIFLLLVFIMLFSCNSNQLEIIGTYCGITNAGEYLEFWVYDTVLIVYEYNIGLLSYNYSIKDDTIILVSELFSNQTSFNIAIIEDNTLSIERDLFRVRLNRLDQTYEINPITMTENSYELKEFMAEANSRYDSISKSARMDEVNTHISDSVEIDSIRVIRW